MPIRESGALLPQMLMASWVQSMPRRKWVWVLGSAGQGIFAALIVLAALTLDGAAAGYAICAALGGLALSRAACSVSYKDILGKTVGQSRRGAITGLAGSVSAVGVVILAVLLMSGLFEDRRIVIAAIALAAGLWGAAALLFSTLKEMKSDPSKGEGADFGILKKDANLRRFYPCARVAGVNRIGPAVFRRTCWGRGPVRPWPARCIGSGICPGVFPKLLYLGAVVGPVQPQGVDADGMCGGRGDAGRCGAKHAGAGHANLGDAAGAVHPDDRLSRCAAGRSTYLVDMSPENQRSAYAAVSNTVIGLLLLVAGVAGGGVALIGPTATLVLFALMAIGAAAAAIGLREVEAAD